LNEITPGVILRLDRRLQNALPGVKKVFFKRLQPFLLGPVTPETMAEYSKLDAFALRLLA
jgi:hypothetical protein